MKIARHLIRSLQATWDFEFIYVYKDLESKMKLVFLFNFFASFVLAKVQEKPIRIQEAIGKTCVKLNAKFN